MKILTIIASQHNFTSKTMLKAMFDKRGIQSEFDYLSNSSKNKILKSDITLDFNKFSGYDLVCIIGADVLKHVTGLTGITKYNGLLVNDKFLPIMDPCITLVKPQTKPEIENAIDAIAQMVSTGVVARKQQAEKDYKHITDELAFSEYIKELETAKYIVVDIETSSLSARKGTILGIALSTRPHQGVYVSASIIELFQNELHTIFYNKKCIFHNAKFDCMFLKREFGFEFSTIEDTMLLHYALDESMGSHGLKQLAAKYTDLGDYDLELDTFKKKWAKKHKIKLADFTYDLLPEEILAQYAMRDPDATAQLYEKFYPIVQANANLKRCYETLLKPFSKAVMHIEDVGGPISMKALNKLISELTIDIEEIKADIKSYPEVQDFEQERGIEFNPNSVFHLRDLLFNRLKLRPLKRTATGADSTDIEVLESLDHPIVEAILELRKVNKVLGTYLSNIKDNVDYDGRLRSNFNVASTTSGRLSSSGSLNYQNLPRDKGTGIKQVFEANPGFKIIQADLGTAEVYVAAALSKDPFFCKAFIDKLDFHSYVAKNIFRLDCAVDEVKSKYKEHRQWAKAITFGVLYGAGPNKISETAEVSIEEAKEFIAKYFKQAPLLDTWIKNQLAFIRKNAFTYSAFGRKRRLPEVTSDNPGVAKHAERSGLNFLIQSVASDINMLSMCDTIDYIKQNNLTSKMRVFATVHDSIVAEVADEYIDQYVAILTSNLQKDRGVFIEGCPIVVDVEVGHNWGELKGYVKK